MAWAKAALPAYVLAQNGQLPLQIGDACTEEGAVLVMPVIPLPYFLQSELMQTSADSALAQQQLCARCKPCTDMDIVLL